MEEKRLLKRLRQSHYNLVNKFVKVVLNSVNDDNSIQCYADKWIMEPENQKMSTVRRRGIRLNYLQYEWQEIGCRYSRKCNTNTNGNGNRVLNELMGRELNNDNDNDKDYCTCFIFYKTLYQTKLRRIGINNISELESSKLFLIPVSKIKNIKYDLQGLKPIIVWKGTYWDKNLLFNNRTHRKAGIRRTPWNEIRKILMEEYGIYIKFGYQQEYLIIELTKRYYEFQNLKIIQKNFPNDVVNFHIKPFLEESKYKPVCNPKISLFFNLKDKM
jgi:hypothetical protein